MTVGRPPDPKRSGTSYLIKFPDQDFINDLDVIAKREGISRKALVLKFLREGIENHRPGNPQTLLKSYSEEGAQTINQFVGQIRQKFYKSGGASWKEILEAFKEEGITDGAKRVAFAKLIVEWLKGHGLEVSY